jgi:hypothetical protein
VNGDGIADIIAGGGPNGGPVVATFDGRDGKAMGSFFAFDPSFRGGIDVAAQDLNGDGVADIIAGPGPGVAPTVEAFGGATYAPLGTFDGFEPEFLDGVTVG